MENGPYCRIIEQMIEFPDENLTGEAYYKGSWSMVIGLGPCAIHHLGWIARLFNKAPEKKVVSEMMDGHDYRSKYIPSNIKSSRIRFLCFKHMRRYGSGQCSP